ncbi:SseB family protein [Seohaeicola saemankumensis]|uniref:SseB family protein n=1 Tax=Seohaeicola saemankumensis TaxID=481181 RepID=UPI001E284835|nr:SseB family protein [Seohaeicola saemankumensis]MCD1627175.1 SseB family protein [Seohaeicola saemankumensis]
MTDLTPLDTAHAAMEAAPDEDAARLRFYERLADCELFVLLTQEAEGDNISPEVFDLADESFVLVFDREDRLAQFVGKPAPYAALSGRVIAGLLAEQGIGMGVNLDVAPSSILIPPQAVVWLAGTLGNAPSEAEARIEALAPPRGLPDLLLTSLDAKLASAAGLADAAYLLGVTYEGGSKGHVLAFVDAAPGAQGALARAVAEALTFSGIEAGALDVAFFRASEPMSARLAQHGLRFDLPQPVETVQEVLRMAPGSDPAKPPILR